MTETVIRVTIVLPADYPPTKLPYQLDAALTPGERASVTQPVDGMNARLTWAFNTTRSPAAIATSLDAAEVPLERLPVLCFSGRPQ